MFCKYCGKELKDGSRFCVHCGARLEEEAAAAVEAEVQQEDIGEEEKLRKIIGKHADDYLAKFADLRSGGKDRMNWASFFLSLIHAAYRNVWKDWLKALKWPLLMEAVCLVLAGICFLANPVVGMFLMLPVWIGSMWMLVMQILFAKRFNRVYMRHVEQKLGRGDINPDPSGKRVIVVWLVYAAVYLVISLMFSAGVMGSLSGTSLDYAEMDRELLEYAEGLEDEEVSEEEWIPEDVDIPQDEWEEEAAQTQDITVTPVIWEGGYQRAYGPSTYLMIVSEDEQGMLFSMSVGYSGYLAYVDIREYEAEWQEEGMAVYREDDYELSFFKEEDGSLWLLENQDSPYGVNLGGIYYLEENAVYPDCEYVFPDHYVVSEEDCEGLTALECRIAKNEIYARHGRRFKDEALQNYFDSCSWYEGYIEPEDFTEQMLTDSDMLSLHAIEAYESRMGF